MHFFLKNFLDTIPVSSNSLGQFFGVDGKQLQQQYKEHLSDYYSWEHVTHAHEWIVFPENISPYLTIDETSLSQGELYTIITNKLAHGKKGTIVAMVQGTEANRVIEVLHKISLFKRHMVKEVTLDMAPNMVKIVSNVFPKAIQVTDRFHVQQLAFEAVQDLRIKYRWEAIDNENEKILFAKENKIKYEQEILSNGDTIKQLLVRSRFVLFKSESKWTYSQKERADLLFEKYPQIKRAYDLAMKLNFIFEQTKDKGVALTRLAQWYNKVEESNIETFQTVARTIQTHYLSILNFFNNRSTNAAAESFNAKIKAFRASFRGVRDINFFLFRLSKIYA
ncbi:MAG: Transposase [Bacteroidetes bacterium ADurb.Bin217]|nr:MAG: Transposase [Bacteroidetes bacterium ADurb.Bin217]